SEVPWPLDLKVTAGDKLYVAKLVPLLRQRDVTPQAPQVTVSDISVRYSVKRTTEVNVGSLVKPFQVVNTGDVPCKHQDPCSPDGKWKAAKGSLSLEAGEGNILRDARASCIAGPCPFTKITLHGFSRGRAALSVTALDWSDTATFLVEAEVFQPMVGDEVRKSYPVIFGRVLHFTVPASAEGVCLEADIHGTPIVFPLGPSPVFQLQWADCRATVNPKQTEVYRCELTPGYRF
ncbi:MAG: carboxypeptidase regulatory-like domain-containing protein, partial [Terriglobia bacterium]